MEKIRLGSAENGGTPPTLEPMPPTKDGRNSTTIEHWDPGSIVQVKGLTLGSTAQVPPEFTRKLVESIKFNVTTVARSRFAKLRMVVGSEYISNLLYDKQGGSFKSETQWTSERKLLGL